MSYRTDTQRDCDVAILEARIQHVEFVILARAYMRAAGRDLWTDAGESRFAEAFREYADQSAELLLRLCQQLNEIGGCEPVNQTTRDE